MTTAGKSVQSIPLIQRSLRCFHFGLLGLVPMLGLGLALLSLRQARQIFAELEQPWRPPSVQIYWLLAGLFIWGYGELFGPVWAFWIFWLFTAMQIWHVWRTLPAESRIWWNPALPHLRAGVLMAYAGCLGSLAVAEAVVILLMQR